MSKAKRETVAHLTYFVVQAYKAVKGMRGGISAEDAREARDHDHAMALFERLKPGRAGVVAFRRTGSPVTGEFEDAVIIARHGRLPPEVDGLTDDTEIEADSWELGEGDLKVA
ncbi:MAG: hypothetical protein ABS59_02925 [Methylobacterium sp. SCN 67-24]|nr:MAG: hypothetical protein ABS59_02925 [Methylobacterium sp. SCN 67-24]